ncbi:helix-hairpin-helix domain-containing protein [Mahella sp.]|uniref:helix-hairpin-helix domain-containing protein n=1 Tax=Mahella sp. TaxID=2798721 RepID=UPI0025C49EA1|nr:helix-hairpin-helix domain-containing protein [Mahella sp.]MBZ4666031.1 competence protein ComEA helix-hairpin-helix repeat protein [Mahella sp.]
MHNMSRGQQVVFIVLIAALLIETGVMIWTGRAEKAFNDDIIIDAKSMEPLDEAVSNEKGNDESADIQKEQLQTIKVYVSGSVNKPGVYELSDGDRVEAAIQAAGGVSSDADMSGINLAQRLKDEDMIYVPKVGEAASSVISRNAQQKDGKIDINSATIEELDKLPGIGPAKAQNIIDYREQNGPFKAIEDIQQVSGIGPATFEDIKDLIVAR